MKTKTRPSASPCEMAYLGRGANIVREHDCGICYSWGVYPVVTSLTQFYMCLDEAFIQLGKY